ncbi:hypothetical protein FRB99_001532 [Tulasnella sp. 403]|nr:hypothetical protein FRB99_001532 [Tulasnella sp. 403]
MVQAHTILGLGFKVGVASQPGSPTACGLLRNKPPGVTLSATRELGRKADNGTRVHGYQFIFSNPNQSWDLVDKDGYYSIQNAKTKTCLELKDGSLDNGAQAQCINYIGGDDNQLWFLDRRSRTPNEIQYVLQAKHLLSDLFEPPNDNGTQYLILPSRLREDIYTSSGLDKSIRRPGAFDYENFVIKSKDAVASWVRDNIALDGCGALFGIVYGSLRGGRYSYNWTLTKDCQSVVFFDAYTGDEFTTTTLEQLGFRPRFGTF